MRGGSPRASIQASGNSSSLFSSSSSFSSGSPEEEGPVLCLSGEPANAKCESNDRTSALTTLRHSSCCTVERWLLDVSGTTANLFCPEVEVASWSPSDLVMRTQGMRTPGPLSPSARNVVSSLLMKITPMAPAAAARRAFTVNGTIPRLMSATFPRSWSAFRIVSWSASGGSLMTTLPVKAERGPNTAYTAWMLARSFVCSEGEG
mmetsp:Transcript_50999/g.120755  ORF Transcript_50999/g.120755 Transcript_50999/m.120755 type:complete len:205 (+) Transcript_50999:2916-3530(+)